MLKRLIAFIGFMIVLLAGNCCFAQGDSIILPLPDKKISSAPTLKISDTLPLHSPRKAAIRSAILPGWGQVYNKKYWKVPLVYGALGTTTFLFFRNLTQYNDSREAYKLAVDNDPSNDDQIKQPYYSVKDQPERIKSFRNAVRQNMDYCVLFFILFWGLNVVDASVDAHLKSFDVSDNLSIHIRAGYSPLAKSNALSLVIPLGSK
ncbi:MAG: DUF5683 domain-containing protein [Sphingobacteriales bacterium]|jgi:hypothetical protein|nr:DUF5683 domain-containing protein [Sphingobacteriales bacterium]